MSHALTSYTIVSRFFLCALPALALRLTSRFLRDSLDIKLIGQSEMTGVIGVNGTSSVLKPTMPLRSINMPESVNMETQYEPRHEISNNVAFSQVQTQTSQCSLDLA